MNTLLDLLLFLTPLAVALAAWSLVYALVLRWHQLALWRYRRTMNHRGSRLRRWMDYQNTLQ